MTGVGSVIRIGGIVSTHEHKSIKLALMPLSGTKIAKIEIQNQFFFLAGATDRTSMKNA